MKIRIEWLSDDYDCETCGPSYADGARVHFDGLLVAELLPAAHCFGGTNYTEKEVYGTILSLLGHSLEQESPWL